MRGAVGLFILALWIYCIFDVITTDGALMRNLPKFLWLAIVIFLPTIGSIVWLVAGRPERSSFRIGYAGAGPPARRPIGPEDRADFSPILRDRDERAELRMREAQLRRREEEVRRRELAAGIDDEETPPPPELPPAD